MSQKRIKVTHKQITKKDASISKSPIKCSLEHRNKEKNIQKNYT